VSYRETNVSEQLVKSSSVRSSVVQASGSELPISLHNALLTSVRVADDTAGADRKTTSVASSLG